MGDPWLASRMRLALGVAGGYLQFSGRRYSHESRTELRKEDVFASAFGKRSTPSECQCVQRPRLERSGQPASRCNAQCVSTASAHLFLARLGFAVAGRKESTASKTCRRKLGGKGESCRRPGVEASCAGFSKRTETIGASRGCGGTDAQRRRQRPLGMLQTIATHNRYHVGQVVAIRLLLDSWPPPSGGLTW
jgi:hypothetical protein